MFNDLIRYFTGPVMQPKTPEILWHCSWCGSAFTGEPAATSTADPGRMKVFHSHECLIAWLDARDGV